MAGNANRCVADFNPGAERFYTSEGAVAIAGGGEIAEFAGPVGKRRQHSVAMRNGLVSGDFDSTGERLHRKNGFSFHDYGQFSTSGRAERESRKEMQTSEWKMPAQRLAMKARRCLYAWTVGK